ncbi:M20/M25/M40 family metallo-hydrolase [Sphingorhabdus sp. Alg239-R122]|uniref:M20/M25/M40 family metallo-hydrolase n=1 Tax=Sphingorhabdus sp. Alg239-R122 TaxID=2305989 RepID=UPI0013D99B16|nr:M20/M25/M40 family metallo-hydrolase [Sphingorhabdus sp. Alg239-R122]
MTFHNFAKPFLYLAAALHLALPVQAHADSAAEQASTSALAKDYDRVINQLVTITEIPAPPFKEQARGEWMMAEFARLGLKDVTRDKEGNILAIRRGSAPEGTKLLVVSAHLDTVFPEGTEIKVTRDGDILRAPGIGDDSLGLTALLAWVRAMNTAGIAHENDILFVATVGEEGVGDLRGVRHIFTEGQYRGRIGAFISVDGSKPARIVHRAVGSKRYRVTFKGPGGHSYGAYGIVNPMAAMADAVRRLYDVHVPADPKTTYSASVVSGGRSVNTIPDSISLEVDMRSPAPDQLKRLEDRFLTIVDQAVEAENFARSTQYGKISVEKLRIGDRPAGMTRVEHPLVKTAVATLESYGFEPELRASSTDSNVAMSAGIPAITIGTGAGGGRAHAVDEYLNVARDDFIRGLSAGLILVLRAAELDYEDD